MPAKICLVCGTTYPSPPSKDRQYCSWKCHSAAVSKKHERECPICGKHFSNTHHPEQKYCSLQCRLGDKQQDNRFCETCGKGFHVKPSSKRRFCSRACWRKREIPTSDKHEHRNCEHCGNLFKTWKYRTTKYCSRKCHGAARSAASPSVECLCEECGQSYQVSRFFVEKRHSRYCSHECRFSAMSRERQGAGNVNYRGGSVEYRGANWRRQSRLARIRDGYRCQVCRKKVGQKPHDHGVHHIRPYRTFEGDWQSANVLANLITLCAPCHTRVEFGELACPQPLF